GDRPHVSLVEKFCRRVMDLPVVTFSLEPGKSSSLHDQGAVQASLDELIARLSTDPTLLRDFTGNRVVPVEALHDAAAFQRFLQRLRGAPELPAWRASLRVRACPIEQGLRVEIHLCNSSRRDLERPSNDQFSTLYDAEVSVQIEQGTLVP